MVRPRGHRARLPALIAALLAILVAFWQQQRHGVTPAPTAPPAHTRSGAPAEPRADVTGTAEALGRAESTLPELAPKAAPPTKLEAAVADPSERQQVQAVVALIAKGGPFPYRKDGSTFSNREGKLPQQPRGYYREYTVETPGEDDRGARRIVQGRDGDTWYTRDHYRTFARID